MIQICLAILQSQLLFFEDFKSSIGTTIAINKLAEVTLPNIFVHFSRIRNISHSISFGMFMTLYHQWVRLLYEEK